MKRTWMLVYAASLLVGLALWRLAPGRWELEFPQAILLGSALYFGALNRYTLRATAGADPGRGGWRGWRGEDPRPAAEGGWRGLSGLLAGLIPRAAFFLVLTALQAFACFEWMPTVDVRSGFVLSGTWLVSLSLIDPPPGAKMT